MIRAEQWHLTHGGCTPMRQSCSNAKHAHVPGGQQLCSEAGKCHASWKQAADGEPG